MIDLKIISEVVANHLCTECGTCAGVCPTRALEMRETPGGQVLPVLTERLCTECGLCDLACPELELSPRFEGALAEPFHGPVVAAYLADAIDPNAAGEGQTGGLGRALLAWGLETGRVQGVVTVVDDPEAPLRPKALIARDPQQVLTASRSKYCPVPVNDLLMEMVRFPGRLAYVGLSCHMQGLELFMQRNRRLREKVVMRLGLFCDRVLTYEAAAFHARCAGVTPQDEVATFDYRSKQWHGWPGDIRVTTRDGRVLNARRTHRTHSRALFTPVHCRLCPDKLNVLCDIALGDPHGVLTGRHVPTALLVRSAAGEEWLRAAEAAGRVRLGRADGAAIIKGQHIDKHTGAAKQCGREMRRRGFRLPVFLADGPLRAGTGRRPAWVRLAVWWGIASQAPWGLRLLRLLPTWEPLVWAWVKRNPVRWLKTARRASARLAATGRLRGGGTGSGRARKDASASSPRDRGPR